MPGWRENHSEVIVETLVSGMGQLTKRSTQAPALAVLANRGEVSTQPQIGHTVGGQGELVRVGASQGKASLRK